MAVGRRQFLLDHLESRGVRPKLTDPSFWALSAVKSAEILAHFSQSESGNEMASSIWDSYPRLGPGQRVSFSGGGLQTISPVSSGIAGRSSAINGSLHLGDKRGTGFLHFVKFWSI